MDSQHRHELEQNDLATFLSDFGTFWNRWGTPIIGTVAILALGFAAYNLITARADAAQQEAWLDLYGSINPESLELIAEDTDHAVVGTLANLRAADLYLNQSHTASPEQAQTLLTSAQNRYQKALDGAPHDVYRLNALEGLGVVAEARFDTAEARQYYEQVKTVAGETYPQWSARADRRLALLEELSTPVAFAPAPAAEPDADSASTAAPTAPTASTEASPEAPADAAAPSAAPAPGSAPEEGNATAAPAPQPADSPAPAAP